MKELLCSKFLTYFIFLPSYLNICKNFPFGNIFAIFFLSWGICPFCNDWIVREKHLYSGLRKVQPHRQLLPGEHIRVLRVPEGLLKLVQLIGCESRARSSHLARSVGFTQIQWIVQRIVDLMIAQVTELRVTAVYYSVWWRRVVWNQ